MKTRRLLCLAGILLLTSTLSAKEPTLATRIVLATYRIEHPKTSGTAFVVSRPDPDDANSAELVLVTAAHAFERMEGETAKLILRKQDANDAWLPAPFDLTIRQDGKPLWHKHPRQDVAVLRLPKPMPDYVTSVPITALANADDWEKIELEPGQSLRCVGFPHAAQFKPSKAGFPLTRVACVASYPLLPYKRYPTFLVDFNVFEGDSGGAVYCQTPMEDGTSGRIVGLTHAQHFIDEKYDLIYQKGQIRKRLGVAIITSSQAILETIEEIP